MCGLADWCVFGLLVIAAWIDWKKKEIPVWFLIFMSVVVLGLTAFHKNIGIGYRIWGLCFGIFFLLISKITKQMIGYADSWLILLLGVYQGIFHGLCVLFAASFMAAMCSLVYLWKRRWKRNETLPFIPFLAMAYLGVMCG